MKDQVVKFSSKGIKCVFISSDPGSTQIMAKEIHEGRCQLVYFSPESLINNCLWRRMLNSEPYQSNLIALVVDQAYCVKKW